MCSLALFSQHNILGCVICLFCCRVAFYNVLKTEDPRTRALRFAQMCKRLGFLCVKLFLSEVENSGHMVSSSSSSSGPLASALNALQPSAYCAALIFHSAQTQ